MPSDLFERISENGQAATVVAAKLRPILAAQHLSEPTSNRLLSGIYARRVESAQLALEAETVDDPQLQRVADAAAALWDQISTLAAKSLLVRRAA